MWISIMIEKLMWGGLVIFYHTKLSNSKKYVSCLFLYSIVGSERGAGSSMAASVSTMFGVSRIGESSRTSMKTSTPQQQPRLPLSVCHSPHPPPPPIVPIVQVGPPGSNIGERLAARKRNGRTGEGSTHL